MHQTVVFRTSFKNRTWGSTQFSKFSKKYCFRFVTEMTQMSGQQYFYDKNGKIMDLIGLIDIF